MARGIDPKEKTDNSHLRFYPVKTAAILFCAVFLFLGLGGKALAATTHYVRTDGNDTYCTGATDAAWNSVTSGGQPCAWTTLDYALTGSHISYGDTVIIDAGTYQPTARINSSIGGVYSSQTTTIRAKTGDAVYINIPVGCVPPLIIVKPGFLLQHLNFTNTNSIGIVWLNLYVTGSYTVQDSTFDGNSTSTGAVALNADNSTVTLIRDQFKNLSTAQNYAIAVSGHTGSTVQIYSSLFNGAAIVAATSNTTSTNIDIRNNTVYGVPSGAYPVSLNNANSSSVGTFGMYNNVIETSAADKYGVFITDNPGTYYVANSSTFNMKGNIFYYPNAVSPSDPTPYDDLVVGNSNLIPVDATNRFINPNFVSTSTPDFHLNNTGTTNYASERGVSGYLPASDVTGASWAGANDVGCYANPTVTANPLVLNNLAAFVGDSIMEGTAATNQSSTEYGVFNALTGKSVVTSSAGVGGEIIQGSRWLADSVAFTAAPDTIFYAIGVNNIYHGGGSSTPPNMTTQQGANEVATVMQKIAALGIKPIWLGAESGEGTSTPTSTLPNTNNASTTDYNNKVQTLCIANGWSCGSILNQMMFNSNWWQTEANGGYYSNPDIFHDIHPANAGHLLIGQLAEYLYYNHHTVGTDKVSVNAGARIYANGQFRDLGTTGSSTATLSITPQGGTGSFTAGNDAFWLDVTGFTNWTNAHKTWTESNAATSSLITDHLVGDLDASRYYTISVTGASATSSIVGTSSTSCATASGVLVCQANASGALAFEYSGGYSTHTFNLSEDNALPTVSMTAPAPSSTASGTITISALSSAVSPAAIASIQFYLDGSPLGSAVSSSPGAISWNTATASNASHTIYALATDSYGNAASSTPIAVTVDNLAPSVSITSPAAGATVSGNNVSVIASSADTESGVAIVRFYLDGSLLGQSTASPFTTIWDTTQSANGAHNLSAIATDGVGNATTSAAVSVTVNNAPAVPCQSVGVAAGYAPPASASLPPAAATTIASSSAGGILDQLHALQAQLASLEQRAGQPTSSPSSASVSSSFIFTRNLSLKSTGTDVKMLQKFLNAKGFPVSQTGPGSSGNETESFGSKTLQALARFQKSAGIVPAQGYFGPATRKYVNGLGR
jgi:lysophospholipase L1-like esterase